MSRFEFDADFFPRLADGGTTVSLMKDGNCTFTLSKPVLVQDLAASVEKGSGGARGSGLLGARERAATGSAAMGADAYIDLPPTKEPVALNRR